MTFPATAPRNAWTHEADFDGLIPYIGREAAWSAAHSNISLAWPRSDAPGLQLLQTMVGWSGTLITQQLLRWRLDVAEGTREIFSGVKGPNMFFPLLLHDLPLPEDEVRRIIESHMLSPDEFFRPLPFPSLSYDDPKFDPKGYWRGRVWPHIGFIMLQILWKHGYRDQADQCAGWFLDLYNQTPWFHETYYAAPLEAEQPSRPTHGVREYNWAQATVIRLLLRRYRDPIC